MRLLLIAALVFVIFALLVETRRNQAVLQDYQIQLDMDTVTIYDRGRVVGKFTTDFTSKYDSVFIKDNL